MTSPPRSSVSTRCLRVGPRRRLRTAMADKKKPTNDYQAEPANVAPPANLPLRSAMTTPISAPCACAWSSSSSSSAPCSARAPTARCTRR